MLYIQRATADNIPFQLELLIPVLKFVIIIYQKTQTHTHTRTPARAHARTHARIYNITQVVIGFSPSRRWKNSLFVARVRRSIVDVVGCDGPIWNINFR